MHSTARPSRIDRAFQLGYFVAYRVMRGYWRVRRPVTHGAAVALWNAGEILLVRSSYIPHYSAPGGYVHRNENARDAAARELYEEVGIRVAPESLEPAIELMHPWEHKLDHVQLFQLELAQRPEVRIDHREIIEAAWFTSERALSLDLYPPVRQLIKNRS